VLSKQLKLEVPKKLTRLMLPARVKVAFGGRGGGKTVSVTDLAIAKMLATPNFKILALREFMNSISDSMHASFKSRIAHHGLEGLFDVTNNEIRCKNGSSVIYGQLARNIESIKSKDSIDLAIVEEAETVSERSIEVLEPSIRAEGSEVWYLLNPKDEHGAVYKKYIAPNLEVVEREGVFYDKLNGGLLLVKVNIDDNPFAPEVLKEQSERMKREDYKKWLHIWGGHVMFDDEHDNFIKADLAVAAAKADAVQKSGAKIIGVDPARFGNDCTAIIRREGRVAYNLARFSNQSTMQTAGRVALIIKVEKPDMVFIDVGGLGGGIVDRLKELGYGEVVKGINFGGKASQDDRYANKRAEMWGNMKEWLEEGGVSIPDDSLLIKDIVTPKYKIKSNGTIQLESKDEMRKRGVKSPDAGDALALTFAMPVMKKTEEQRLFDSESSFFSGDSVAGY